MQDVERGVLHGIHPLPWQTDTSKGDWFYNEKDRCKSAWGVITMLADIVSRNGDMLLNILLHDDSRLPAESERLLAELGPGWPQDISFNTRAETLYAITLGEPRGPVAITTLGRSNPQGRRRVRQVRLLGHRGAIDSRRTDQALVITPPRNPAHAPRQRLRDISPDRRGRRRPRFSG